VPPLVDILLARIELISGRMFPMASTEGLTPDYEPNVMTSFLARARQRGCTALEALYDHFAEGDGGNLVYFPLFNYNGGNLDVVRQMLEHPRALFGLSDAGAHVGTVCDASATTFLLTHWARDRPERHPGDRLTLERAVHLLSGRNAAYLGLADRGRIAPGLRADLNLIDPVRLGVGTPHLVRDMPAGGKRFLQKGQGYVCTWVAGQCVQRDGEITPSRPGRLVRLGH
jgi:N-acyl-D-aspartate/D-glutamate deacylase